MCPHFGGDYWFHFGPKEGVEYFCNIPSVSDGWDISPPLEKAHSHVLGFLKGRNGFLGRAIEYFEDNVC